VEDIRIAGFKLMLKFMTNFEYGRILASRFWSWGVLSVCTSGIDLCFCGLRQTLS
jgi:hypothetical protein